MGFPRDLIHLLITQYLIPAFASETLSNAGYYINGTYQ
jgi:hypothetical protein